MANKLYEETSIQAIAAAIRQKTGGSDTYTVGQMASAIASIPSGGGGGDEATILHAMMDNTDATILQSYTIPADITDIRSNAFRSFRVINITSDDVLTVENEGFRYNDVIQTIFLPNCTHIKESVIRDMSALVSVNFPKLAELNNREFETIASMQTLSLPALTAMGNYNFRTMNALTKLVLPKVPIITDNSIYNLPLLENLSLPACTQIRNAIKSCASLNNLFLPGSTMASVTNNSAFTATPILLGTGHVWVNDDLYDSYLSASWWSSYLASGVIQKISDYTGDFDYNEGVE